MILSHLILLKCSQRFFEDQGLSEFIFTDFFQTSLQPLTNTQAAQACVALTSDLKITAANATCARNQAVLFVRGQRTPTFLTSAQQQTSQMIWLILSSGNKREIAVQLMD